MEIFTGFVLVDIFGIIVAILTVIYAYFQWIYQTWKRKNVPYLQPKFPFGNRKPIFKAESIGEDVFNIVKQAQQKGKQMFENLQSWIL